MATDVVPATGPVANASSFFPDLFGLVDGVFDRYVKYQEYRTAQKSNKLVSAQNNLLAQLNDTATQSQATSGLPKEAIYVLGGVAALAVLMMLKR